MKLKVLLLGSVMFCCGCVLAQNDPESDSVKASDNLSIHGNLDLYYKSGLDGPGKNGPPTSFTHQDRRFELGMASLQLSYRYRHGGVVIDLGFGPRAREFAYTDDAVMAAVKQGYIYYEPLKGLRLSAGTWATHIGYEVLDPALNANYSMSYLFSTGPFSNTGVKAEYAFGHHHLMAGVSNPTDYRHVPDSLPNDKTMIARYSYERENGLVLALNYTGGRQVDHASVRQLDGVAVVPVTAGWSLGWNGSIVFRKQRNGQPEDNSNNHWQHWWGQAVYLRGRLSQKWELAMREEYFADEKGMSVIPLKGHVWSTTATLRYKEGPFTIMPEIRWDQFSRPYGLNDGDRGEVYGLLAVTYQF